MAHVRLAPGQRALLVLSGLLSDGSTQDVTPGAKLSTSEGLEAAMRSTAVELRAVEPGRSSLLLQAESHETVVTVEVTKLGMTSLVISESADRSRLIATATWEDGVELDVSELVEWHVDGAGVTVDATLGRRGLVGATGDAHVVAELNGLKA
ncbi:MAG: hypothetical protein AB1730_08075 [Myxococcota bacterium]